MVGRARRMVAPSACRRIGVSVLVAVGCVVFLLAQGESAQADQCPAGSSRQTVNDRSFSFSGCMSQVDRAAGSPIDLFWGPVSLGGVTVAPTGADTSYAPVPFVNCEGGSACGTAMGHFWSATNGPQLAFDPNDLQLASNGSYLVSISIQSSTLKLYSGRINIPPPLTNDSALIDLDVSRGAALLGLPLQGRFQLFAQTGGVRLHVFVGLPGILGGVTGETDVSVLNDGSVRLNQLHLAVGGAEIGGLRLGAMSFLYDANDARGTVWSGSANLSLPAPTPYYLRLELTLINGGFSSISGSAANLNVSLGYGVFLQNLGATFQLTPRVIIGGSLGLSAGPSVLRRTAMEIEGALRVLFPGRELVNGKLVNIPYTRVEGDGSVRVVGESFAHGYLGIQTNGYVEAGGTVGKAASFGSLEAVLRGEATATSFNLAGSAHVSVHFLTTLSATGHAVVSNKGLAGCADFGWLSGGVGYKWGQGFALFRGCDLGPYTVIVHPSKTGRRAGAAQATQTITIPGGLPEEGIEVLGTTAPPQFTLVAPDGTRIKTPSDVAEGALASRYAIVRQTENNSTNVVLRAPGGGKWRLVPATGSASISAINQASGLAPAQASVTVSGSGRLRTLHWHLLSEPGQVVQFVEQGADDSKVLATTDKPDGQEQFTVPDGIAGERTIDADFQEAGVPRADDVAGHYQAPGPPVPERPADLGLRREGSQVGVQWTQPGQQPDHYELTWRASDGEDQLLELPGDARSAAFNTDLPTDSVRVTLQPFSTDDVAGPTAGFDPAGAGIVVVDDCRTPASYPASIQIGCVDTTNKLAHIVWKTWGLNQAQSLGTATASLECVPNCASGRVRKAPVRVTLSKPIDCPDNGPRVWSSLTYTFVGPLPPIPHITRIQKQKLFCPLQAG